MPDRQASRLLVLLSALCLGWGACSGGLSGCGMLPEPVEPPGPQPDPIEPLAACERSCVRYLGLGCEPVMDLGDCAKACEQMEAFAAEAGASIGWNPSKQAEAETCEQWESLRGNGT